MSTNYLSTSYLLADGYDCFHFLVCTIFLVLKSQLFDNLEIYILII